MRNITPFAKKVYQLTKKVPKPATKRNISQVFWRIKSKLHSHGVFTISITMIPDNLKEKEKIAISKMLIK